MEEQPKTLKVEMLEEQFMQVDAFYKEKTEHEVKEFPRELMEHLMEIKRKIYKVAQTRTKDSNYDKAYSIVDVELMGLKNGLEFAILQTIPLKDNWIGLVYQIIYPINDKNEKEKKVGNYVGRQAFPYCESTNKHFEYAGAITYWRRQILLTLMGFGNDDYDPEFNKEKIKQRKEKEAAPKIQEKKKELDTLFKTHPNADWKSIVPKGFSSKSKNLDEWNTAIDTIKKNLNKGVQ